MRRVKHQVADSRASSKNGKFLSIAGECNEKLKFVKCGQRVENYARFPSFAEMIEWAMSNLNCEDSLLVRQMILFAEALKRFEEELQAQRK